MFVKYKEKYPVHLRYVPWIEKGVCHGFTGSECDFGVNSLRMEAGKICQTLGAKALLICEQVHGNESFILSAADRKMLMKKYEGEKCICPGAYDGIVFEECDKEKCIFGIRTADCLPVLLKGNGWSAVVHAGWRGLHAGVVEKAAKEVIKKGGSPIEAVVGPAASGDAYEVGKEVVDCLGRDAVYKEARNKDRYLLSLAGTLGNRLAREFRGAVIFQDSEVCTISDKSFHSWRRSAGCLDSRNLAFMLS